MVESTAEKTEKKVNVKDMTVIALVTAVICIIAPFSTRSQFRRSRSHWRCLHCF